MKYRFRRSGEIVDIISYSQGVDRSENDWVSYIDSKGGEHHKVKGYNFYWDFEIAPCNEDIYFKWEYKAEKIAFDSNTFIDILNKYGKEGWELVDIMDRLGGFKLFIFKKPVIDNPICNCNTL